MSSNAASQQENQMKKKLQSFLGEMIKLGTVKGFKYFTTYVRGREEMIISILNKPTSPCGSLSGSEPSSPIHVPQPSNSFTSQNLPYDKRSLMLSQKTQMSLSGFGEKGVGLPPASPSDEETQSIDEESTLFLIAGYTRYSCPYVWVRSNHQRLVRLTGSESQEKDSPLRLKSTSKWKNSNVCIWDVVAELVKLCTYPAPRNPFAVDLVFFSSLPLQERILSTAAMIAFLEKLLIHTSEEKPYAAKVFEDLQLVTKVHYSTLQDLITQGQLPIFKVQEPAVRSSHVHNTPTHRQRYPSGSQYPQSYSQPGYASFGYS